MTDHEKKMATLREDFNGCESDHRAGAAFDRLDRYAEELEEECTRLRGCSRDAQASLPIMLAGYVTRDMMSHELDRLHDYLCDCDARGQEGADKTAVDDAIAVMSQMSPAIAAITIAHSERGKEIEELKRQIEDIEFESRFADDPEGI